MTFTPGPAFEPAPPAECSCENPDAQYLLGIDAGSAYLVHRACGKRPQGWDEAHVFDMDTVPVTLHEWERPVAHPHGEDDYRVWVTVNGRTVDHDGVPYLIDRDYADRDGALWRITDDRDRAGRPLAYVLPKGSGEDVPLADVVADFGPLTLAPLETS